MGNSECERGFSTFEEMKEVWLESFEGEENDAKESLEEVFFFPFLELL